MRDWTSNPSIRNPRSVFNLSYPIKTTFDAGYLIPLKPLEILPGDTIRARLNALIRMATPIHPVMDQIKATVHFWFSPKRQLHSNSVKMFGEQINPGDSIDFMSPQLTILRTASPTGVEVLADFMGIPIANCAEGNGLTVNAEPFRMYNQVFNEHYRDQDLQSSVGFSTDDGPEVANRFNLLRRGKRHDYLTSAKPFQQKGTAPVLPLGGSANVKYNAGDGLVGVRNSSNTLVAMTPESSGEQRIEALSTLGQPSSDRALFADLSTATGVTITQLRETIAIQHILERDARGGTRYPEQLVSRFGVTDPALLVLQRPEFLGSGSVMINIAPVASTVPTPETATADNVQGNLAAVGTAMINGNIGFTKSFTEHGWVLPIITIQADLTYQQGLDKMWTRKERFDYFTPELAHISEEPIFSREIFADGTAGDNDVWGYNGAYDSYRTGMPLIAGRFKSKPLQGATLDPWILTQDFASRPQLNDAFIQDNPPIDRVVAVKTEPQFIMDGYMSIKAARILPLTGVPGLYRI